MSLVKYASAVVLDAKLAEPGDRHLRVAHRVEFDYEPRPGFLYVRSRAISSRANENHDEFPAEELVKGYKTFIGKPVFVNHDNEDPTKARGVILDAALHPDTNIDGTPDTWVEVLMEVDAKTYPKLAQALLPKKDPFGNVIGPPDIERTSMGVEVEYSICSVCGSKARTEFDYCEHLPRMKGRRVQKDGKAILCVERCIGLSFFENSLLVEPPADPTAVAFGLDTRGLEMVASRKTSGRGVEDHPDWERVKDRPWQAQRGPTGWKLLKKNGPWGVADPERFGVGVAGREAAEAEAERRNATAARKETCPRCNGGGAGDNADGSCALCMGMGIVDSGTAYLERVHRTLAPTLEPGPPDDDDEHEASRKTAGLQNLWSLPRPTTRDQLGRPDYASVIDRDTMEEVGKFCESVGVYGDIAQENVADEVRYNGESTVTWDEVAADHASHLRSGSSILDRLQFNYQVEHAYDLSAGETYEASRRTAAESVVYAYRQGKIDEVLVIAAPSKKAARDALGATVTDFNNYSSETGNPAHVEAALAYPGQAVKVTTIRGPHGVRHESTLLGHWDPASWGYVISSRKTASMPYTDWGDISGGWSKASTADHEVTYTAPSGRQYIVQAQGRGEDHAWVTTDPEGELLLTAENDYPRTVRESEAVMAAHEEGRTASLKTAGRTEVLVAHDWKSEGLSTERIEAFIGDALIEHQVGKTRLRKAPGAGWSEEPSEDVITHRFLFDSGKVRNTEVHSVGYHSGFVVNIEGESGSGYGGTVPGQEFRKDAVRNGHLPKSEDAQRTDGYADGCRFCGEDITYVTSQRAWISTDDRHGAIWSDDRMVCSERGSSTASLQKGAASIESHGLDHTNNWSFSASLPSYWDAMDAQDALLSAGFGVTDPVELIDLGGETKFDSLADMDAKTSTFWSIDFGIMDQAYKDAHGYGNEAVGSEQEALQRAKDALAASDHPVTGTLQKGAPFAGYKDFADCVAQNSEKRDPEAYCGKIKHQVEDKKGRRVQGVRLAVIGHPWEWEVHRDDCKDLNKRTNKSVPREYIEASSKAQLVEDFVLADFPGYTAEEIVGDGYLRFHNCTNEVIAKTAGARVVNPFPGDSNPYGAGEDQVVFEADLPEQLERLDEAFRQEGIESTRDAGDPSGNPATLIVPRDRAMDVWNRFVGASVNTGSQKTAASRDGKELPAGYLWATTSYGNKLHLTPWVELPVEQDAFTIREMHLLVLCASGARGGVHFAGDADFILAKWSDHCPKCFAKAAKTGSLKLTALRRWAALDEGEWSDEDLVAMAAYGDGEYNQELDAWRKAVTPVGDADHCPVCGVKVTDHGEPLGMEDDSGQRWCHKHIPAADRERIEREIAQGSRRVTGAIEWSENRDRGDLYWDGLVTDDYDPKGWTCQIFSPEREGGTYWWHAWIAVDPFDEFDGHAATLEGAKQAVYDVVYGTGQTQMTLGRQVTAYGEIAVPEQVDTIQQTECPVCQTPGTEGKTCENCGYVVTPNALRDPDLDAAQKFRDEQGNDGDDIPTGGDDDFLLDAPEDPNAPDAEEGASQTPPLPSDVDPAVDENGLPLDPDDPNASPMAPAQTGNDIPIDTDQAQAPLGDQAPVPDEDVADPFGQGADDDMPPGVNDPEEQAEPEELETDDAAAAAAAGQFVPPFTIVEDREDEDDDEGGA